MFLYNINIIYAFLISNIEYKCIEKHVGVFKRLESNILNAKDPPTFGMKLLATMNSRIPSQQKEEHLVSLQKELEVITTTNTEDSDGAIQVVEKDDDSTSLCSFDTSITFFHLTHPV